MIDFFLHLYFNFDFCWDWQLWASVNVPPLPLNKYAQNHERRRAHSCTGQIPDNIMSITINRRRHLMFQEFQDCFSALLQSLFFSFCFLSTLSNLLPALLFIMTYSSVKIVWQQVWACKAAQQVVLIPPERGVWLLQFAVNKVVLQGGQNWKCF